MSVGAEGRQVCRDRAGVPYRVPELAGGLDRVLIGVAILSMAAGNILAPAQTNIKRMLAYSSIAHAGYMPARDHRRHSKRAQHRLDLSSHLCFREHRGPLPSLSSSTRGRNQGLRGSGKKPSAPSGRHAGVHVFPYGNPADSRVHRENSISSWRPCRRGMPGSW